MNSSLQLNVASFLDFCLEYKFMSVFECFSWLCDNAATFDRRAKRCLIGYRWALLGTATTSSSDPMRY